MEFPIMPAEVEVKADPRKLIAGKTQGVEMTVESPTQGRGESLVAQLDSAVNQAEQLRDQQIQQQYSDQFGVYVQEKAEQIDRLQSNLAEALTFEQAQLQAIQQRAPGWTARKKSARSMGAAGGATKDQDRADRAALGQGRGD
jgi:topoisomerase IA-like protein